MRAPKPWIVAGLAAISLLPIAAGCQVSYNDPNEAQASSAELNPAIGKFCTVHFRRDALGVASESPIPATTDAHNGASVTVKGEVKAVNGQWLVLTTGSENENEAWVPLDRVLFVEVIDR